MAFGKKSENKAGGKRGKLPVKRSINLAMTDEKPVNFKIGIPALILIIVSRAEARVSTLQSELNAAYDKLNSFGELTEIYAHYTYSGMTQEEISRADRSSAVAMIRRLILPRGQVSSWNLSGNTLTVNMTVDDLRTVNRTVQDIESDEHVNFCSVNTASTIDKYNQSEAVNARLTIYLNPPKEVVRP